MTFPSIGWILPAHMPEGEEVVVHISVPRLDDIWLRTDPDSYVGPGGTGAAIEGRYSNLNKAFRCGAPMEIPQISIYDGVFSFTDGRHRTAWCRDHGILTMPIMTPPECVGEVEKYIGIEQR